MSTITQTTVVFSCPKCGLNYQATQEHSSDQSSGSFDCKNCKTNVLKWSGVYDYSRWTPVPKLKWTPELGPGIAEVKV